MDLNDLFENQLTSKLKEDPSILEGVTKSYVLAIGDECFHLDLQQAREIKSGDLENSDCRIEMSPQTFQKMLDQKLNIAIALATRKIKVSGDLMLFTKLRELF